jgi:hypothetical protein
VEGTGAGGGNLDDEEALAGGVANAGAVVRVGRHVLRPSNEHSATIHRFLSALRGVGFDGASLPVGIDPDGRERLEYVEGDVALPPFPPWAHSDDALASVAALLARFHDASRSFDPAGLPWSSEMADPIGGEIVCHNDVCLENVVFRGGVAVALLDFDFAAPGRPVHDVAAFARMCVPIDDDVNARRLGWGGVDRPARLRLVADAYGLDSSGRSELLGCLDHAMVHGGAFVRRRAAVGEPGFVAVWEQMGGMERYDRRRRWWETSRPDFAATLA